MDEFRLVVIGRWPNNGSSYSLDRRISRLFYMGVFKKQQTCARHAKMFRLTFIIPLNNFVPNENIIRKRVKRLQETVCTFKT